MNVRQVKFAIRNKSAAQTTTIYNFINWFADLHLFRIAGFALAAGIAPALCSASTINITVNNPSFEESTGSPITDWGQQPPNTDGAPGGTIEAYTYAPTVGTVGSDYPGGIPGGVNVAHSDGPIIFQDTDYYVQPDTTYTFSIYVGNPANVNIFDSYRVVLVADGLVITPDQSAPIPASGQWVVATSSGYVGDDPEEVGYQIRVVLDPLDSVVDWDEPIPAGGPIPEPASLGMAGVLVPLVLRRRGKT